LYSVESQPTFRSNIAAIFWAKEKTKEEGSMKKAINLLSESVADLTDYTALHPTR
jgi:hypothetical protein